MKALDEYIRLVVFTLWLDRVQILAFLCLVWKERPVAANPTIPVVNNKEYVKQHSETSRIY